MSKGSRRRLAAISGDEMQKRWDMALGRNNSTGAESDGTKDSKEADKTVQAEPEASPVSED